MDEQLAQIAAQFNEAAAFVTPEVIRDLEGWLPNIRNSNENN